MSEYNPLMQPLLSIVTTYRACQLRFTLYIISIDTKNIEKVYWLVYY